MSCSTEVKPTSGGISNPRCPFILHAAILYAMMQWWKPSDRLSWNLECPTDGIPFFEIALLPGNIQNMICAVFQRIWSRYKCKLISDFSPLPSFLLLPQFQQARLASDFKHWERTKLDTFCNLGDELGMYPEEQVVGRLGNLSSSILFHIGRFVTILISLELCAISAY